MTPAIPLAFVRIQLPHLLVKFFITHPTLVSLAFHIGRTNLEKYSAKPSRLPLYVAVPGASARVAGSV